MRGKWKRKGQLSGGMVHIKEEANGVGEKSDEGREIVWEGQD